MGLANLAVDGEDTWWTEGRPLEEGRQVLVRRDASGACVDTVAAPYNVRSRVHEYGGFPFCAVRGTVWFSDFASGRLHRLDPGGSPRPITPEGDLRYADMVLDGARGRLLCVLEDHTTGASECVNSIAAVPIDGGAPRVIADGHDFAAAPRLSPDGGRLAWLTWDHPDMPWDATRLWVAALEGDGALGEPTLVAGGPGESVSQPTWSRDGRLHLVSDRTGWWNLYAWDGHELEALAPMEAEFAPPGWLLGWQGYAFLPDGRIAATATRDGTSVLYLVEPGGRGGRRVDMPDIEMGRWVRARGARLVLDVASATEPTSFVEIDPQSGARSVLRRSSEVEVETRWLSLPEAVRFPTEDGQTAHAFYYAPHNPEVQAPDGERPPLRVICHGGPTSAASPARDLSIQYFTSRGIGVIDVDYGGSTGYGRAYRERLYGRWGVVDVDDCISAARFLVDRGDADGERLAIIGGSAGGYTTLCALTFRDAFAAGCSLFGIGDLTIFVHDTHKFESRYLERLVGPWPECAELYRERSPINFTDRISCPLILFQGLDDRVVPANQAELMVEALRRKGLPVAYVPFAGEQHGFRIAANIRRCLEGELYFYGRVFGFSPADDIEPVPIENLE